MNKRRIINSVIILILFLCAKSTSSYSQNVLFDSLITAIDSLSTYEQIIHLQKAASLFQNTSLDKGLYFAKESEELLKEFQDDSLMAANYNLKGNLYISSGLDNIAEEQYKISLDIFEGIKNYNGIATETHNLGIIYLQKEDTIKSIDYFKQSLDARIATNNNRRIGDGLTTLGEIYLDFGDYDKSISSLNSAIEYYEGEDIYNRKFECYGFLADNFLSINTERTIDCINKMEEMYSLNNGDISLERYKIDFRMGQYYLRTGKYLEAANSFGKIDFSEIELSSEYNPIETLRELSAKLDSIGEKKQSLHFSIFARNIKRTQEDTRINSILNEYKARLDMRSTDEEIIRTEKLNLIVLERLQTERLLKYALYLIILLLIATVAILSVNFFNIRHAQFKLNERNIELNNAYEKSIAYKENILILRENKGVFFSVLTEKLLIPFSDLTDRLDSLSSKARKSFNKKSFLLQIANIYTLSLSIEKGLKRILIWSKLQRKKYEVDPELINVNDYLHELLPEILKMAISQNIKVSYDTDPGLNVVFDRKAFRSILKVFIENSIDNSPKRSEIIIRAKKARNGGVISVTDFGNGMLPEIQNTLFDVKKREDLPKNKDYKRLGLGLLVSKHLAELNSSIISFESKIKKGTSFYLHIKNKNAREETNI